MDRDRFLVAVAPAMPGDIVVSSYGAIQAIDLRPGQTYSEDSFLGWLIPKLPTRRS